MTKLRNTGGGRLHPWVPELAEMMRRGRIGRRDFLRTTALLGVSVASAKAFMAGEGLISPRTAMAQEGKPGGTLRMAMQTQEITDPANYNWIEASNITRNVIEYLTEVDADNVVHPYLAASWSPSDDLRAWTFKLQQNVKWSNGDDFTTDDVEFNFKRWLDPASKSVNRTQFAGVTFEKKGPHEFVLNLAKPKLSIPEELYAYTCAIVHRSFDETGSDFQKNPIGTGPYDLVEFGIGRVARVTRRQEGYWGKAPYLDEIQYIDLGTDISAHLAALAAQQVDAVYRITPAELDLVKRLPMVQLISGPSAMTTVLRMQIDQKPFDDPKLRQAIILAADNQKILDLALRGQGVVGENHHVAPAHPEYFKLPPVQRDVARAKALADELPDEAKTLKIALGNTQGRFEQDSAQVLAQQLAEIGINLQLDVLPTAQYWPIWDKTPFGVTFWAHRPLGVMTLDLAYRSGAVWNETHFNSPEFDKALDDAIAIVDPVERSKSMESVERMIQEAHLMVQPFFVNKVTAASTRVQNFRMHPAEYFDMRAVSLA